MTSRDVSSSAAFDILVDAISRAEQLPPHGDKSIERLVAMAAKYAEIAFLEKSVIPVLNRIADSLDVIASGARGA